MSLNMAQNNTEKNEYVNWIKEAISKNHIEYYEFEHFKNLHPVGADDLGKVYRANWKNRKQYYGLKSLSDIEDIAVKELVHELQYHREVDFHDNIINFYGITASSQEHQNIIKKYLLVMDYADDGNLADYLRENFNKLSWKEKVKLGYELANVISYLHHKGIVHRNLHSGNILVHQGSIKVADFGLSKRIKEILPHRKSSVFGVIPYIDPKRFGANESLDEKKSDVYGVGVLLWEISYGKPPFFVEGEPYDNILAVRILQGIRETVVPGTPQDYVNLYTECWDGEPNKRPHMIDVAKRLKNIEQYMEKKIEINIIIDKLRDLVFRMINVGKEKVLKDYIQGYFDNNNIDPKIIYNWLLNNHKENIVSTFLLGLYNYYGIYLNIHYESAFNLFFNASEKNHILARYYVGICYQNGHGIIKNESLAYKYFEKLAEMGYAMGQFKLGYLISEGIGTEKDLKTAASCYELAVSNGNIIAMYNLGRKYFYDKDYKNAVFLFEKAAAEEHLDGITMLGFCNQYGIGTEINQGKAFELYQKAARLGSKTVLTFMDGSERNVDQAIFWYKQTADSRDQDS